MVDFNDLLIDKSAEKPTNPLDIYESLDRTSEAGPLRPSQKRILSEWYEDRREKTNTIIKLHTGEGKTLVGLLVLLSQLNSNNGPCLYVCPNVYLAKQVIEDARKFGIPYCTFDDGKALPDEFVSGEKILICHVQKAFNGRTVFGLNHQSTDVGSIILDDSHACIDSIKNSLTIKVDSSHALYKTLINLFSEDLKSQGQGTFMEIESEDPSALLPVPYWAWLAKLDEVAEAINEVKTDDEIKFVWPVIKDSLHEAQCFFSGKYIEIAPSPLALEAFGSFSKADHRILMSATTQDDSFFVKGLGFDVESVVSPLTNEQLHWSGEKMILIPSLIDESLERTTIIEWLSRSNDQREFGIVALTPSFRIGAEYVAGGATQAYSSNIFEVIQSLKDGEFAKTVVLANRYDGIDLPDSSCRILILDSKPFFDSLLDRYEEVCRPSSDTINMRIAQKVEQGLGRSVRGEKDYSVIIILGSDLIRFMRSSLTSRYFSNQTQKQISIGLQIAELGKSESTDKQPMNILLETINQSILRDDGWKRYYPQAMNQLDVEQVQNNALHIYDLEYKAEKYFRSGDHYNAAEIMQQICNETDDLFEKAWYLQQLARYMYLTNRAESLKIQESAYQRNQQLLKPEVDFKYKKLEFINQNRVDLIRQWASSFDGYEDMMLTLNSVLYDLSFGMDHKKFEAAMKVIGAAIGFLSERPDAEIKKGPDNLWCGNDLYFLIECKNEVELQREEIYKSEVGQMNNHCGWFDDEYGSNQNCVRIIVIPTTKIANDANLTHQVTIMNKEKLQSLKSNIRSFYKEFAKYTLEHVNDQTIQTWLNAHKLDVDSLKTNYSDMPN